MWGEKVYGLAHTAHAFHKSQSRTEQVLTTAAGSPFPAGSFPLVLHCNAFTIPSRHRGAQKAVPKKPTPETERPASRAVPAPGLIAAPSLFIARCEISRCSSAPLRLRSDTLRLCDCPWERHGFRFYFDLQQGGRGLFPGPPTFPTGSLDGFRLGLAALRSERGPRTILSIPPPNSDTGGEKALRSEVCVPTLPKSGWNSYCGPVPSRFSGQALSVCERPSL